MTERIGKFNLKCLFLEESPDKIYEIIDQASRINPKEFAMKKEKLDSACLINNIGEYNQMDTKLSEEKSKFRIKKRDLEELKDLFDSNLINEEDYEKAKRKVLNL